MLLIATLVVASPARADHASVQATATGQVTTTDNLFAAGNGGNRETDTFLTIRPGLIYAIDGRRMSHDFSVEGEATEYLVHYNEPSVSGRGAWTGQFLPDPDTVLTLAAGASSGILSSLSSRSTADQTTALVAPGGKVTVYGLDAGEHAAWSGWEFTRLSQSLDARYGLSDDGTGNTSDTREVNAGIGLGRTFTHDTVTLDLSASFLQLKHGTTAGSTTPPAPGTAGDASDRQLNPRATLSWHHDFGRTWSAGASGGLTYVHPLDRTTTNNMGMMVDNKSAVFTVYGAQVGYTELWGHAAVSASRDVAPNLFLAQNTVNDNVSASVAMPLPWLDDTRRNPKLAGAGSITVGRTQIIDAATSAAQSSFQIAHVDLAVTYNRTPSQTWGLRYEFAYQNGDSSAAMVIPSYYRNSLYLTFALRYPERAEGELRRHNRLARPNQAGKPLGLEQVVPDTVDPEPIDLPDLDEH
jgi:hypothetical protein